MINNEKMKNGTAKNNGDGNSDVVLAVALIAVLCGAQISQRAEQFYREYFEYIHYAEFLMLAALLALLMWQIKKRTKDLEKRVARLKPIWSKGSGIYAGRGTESGIDLYVPNKARLGHVQIIGATGRGKTESVILPWIARDIMAVRNVVLIDGKGDPGLAEKIDAVCGCTFSGIKPYVFDLGNLEKSCVTNPLEHGSVQQITDRIFTAFEFQDIYYKRVQYNATRDIVALIHEANETVTFKRLYLLLTDDDLLGDAIAKVTNTELKRSLTRFLAEPRKDRDQRLSGLISQLGPFAEGEVAAVLNGGPDDENYCTVSDVLLKSDLQRVFVILIPTLKYQELGRQLGKILLQELGWAVGERASQMGSDARFTPVYLDEFSAFVYQGFEQILNKARSSQVPLHLSHQSLGDLSMVSPELATVINTNTNVKCLLGLNDPETADFFARHMGTETKEKWTERAQDQGLLGSRRRTGDLSVREVEAYRIHPNALKNYTNGMGVLHMPGPKGNVTEEIQFARIGDNDLYPEKGGMTTWLKAYT